VVAAVGEAQRFNGRRCVARAGSARHDMSIRSVQLDLWFKSTIRSCSHERSEERRVGEGGAEGVQEAQLEVAALEVIWLKRAAVRIARCGTVCVWFLDKR